MPTRVPYGENGAFEEMHHPLLFVEFGRVTQLAECLKPDGG